MAAIRNTGGSKTGLKPVDTKERAPSVSQTNNPNDAMRDALDDMLNKIRRDAGNSDSEDDSDEWSD